MRKRSAGPVSPPSGVGSAFAAATPPPTISQPTPAQIYAEAAHAHPTWQPPANVFVVDGIVFIQCKCGLKQSVESARVSTGMSCITCGAALDPKGELTKDRMIAMVKDNKLGSFTKPSDFAPLPIKEDRTSEQQKADGDACETCGKPLTATALGSFYSCGHDKQPLKGGAGPETPTGKDPNLGPARTVTDTPKPKRESSPGTKFTVTRGEQAFSPVSYNSYRVGPFTVEGVVGPNETLADAMKRVQEQLDAFAEIEFKRKTEEFATRLEVIARRAWPQMPR